MLSNIAHRKHHNSMNLQKEHTDTDEQCNVVLGQKKCARDIHTSGPHVVRYDTGEEYLYDYDDHSQMISGICKTCYEPLTDFNKSERPGCYGYCKLHGESAFERYFARNGCKKCGFVGPHNLLNYDMMWHDGDIHCGRCGAYVRMYDAG